MESLGVDPEQIELVVSAQTKKADYLVNADNWRSWKVFQRCAVQWQRNQMNGQIMGLDWSVAIGVLNLYPRKNRKQLFDDMRLIEVGVMGVLNG